jgi:hypothetical protein
MKSTIQSASILFSVLATIFGGVSSSEASGTIASYVVRKKRELPVTINAPVHQQCEATFQAKGEQKAA